MMNAGPRSIEQILREMPMFRHLSQWEIGAVASCCQRHQFLEGNEVVKEGSPGESFWVIESGWLSLWKNGHTVGQLDPGSHFGKSALLTGKPNSATVKVGSDDAWLWELRKDDFSRFFNDPDLQPKIAMSLTALNAEDITELREAVRGILKAVGGVEEFSRSTMRKGRGTSWNWGKAEPIEAPQHKERRRGQRESMASLGTASVDSVAMFKPARMKSLSKDFSHELSELSIDV